MSGSQPRIRRPVLLLLVYGAFVALVGITATAQAAMVSAHFSAATLNDVVGSDAATIRAFVNAHLDVHYLDESGGGPAATQPPPPRRRRRAPAPAAADMRGGGRPPDRRPSA